MYGQTSSNLPAPPATPPLSRVDVFLGYSYAAPKATVRTPEPADTYFAQRPDAVDYGALGSIAYYANRYIGGQFEYGNHQEGDNDGFQTLQLGLIARFPSESLGIDPFVHGLAGAVRFGGPNNDFPGANPTTFHAYTWGPAFTFGGGLDYDLPWFNHHLAVRVFQADYEYFHVNFGPAIDHGGRLNAGVARLSGGLVFKFGNIVPPPPVAYACSANPAAVFPGEPVTITGTATNLNPKKRATYSWSGEGANSTTSTVTIETANLAPGNHTVTGHVSESTKPGRSADCTAQFTVKEYEPPTISCSANPTTLNPGDSATITATATSPQNRPLTYSYQASAGSINGTGPTATLSTTGAPAGTVTVTCNVADDKGHTASATTSVNISAPPPPPPQPKTQTLCSIEFNHDKRRPARVDNDAKGCLDDVALNLQRSADATLVVVGNAAPAPEVHGRHHRRPENTQRLAEQRAVNTKDYLVTEKGIDANRISVRTDNSGQNEVQNYLVPPGANFENDVQGTTPVDEAHIHAQHRRAAAPATHPHHHHKAASSAATGTRK